MKNFTFEHETFGDPWRHAEEPLKSVSHSLSYTVALCEWPIFSISRKQLKLFKNILNGIMF